MEKKLFVGTVAIFLLTICILSRFHMEDIWALSGEYSVYEEPEFSITSYSSGQYQSEYEDFFSQSYAGYNMNVKLYNQIRYSMFHTANSVVIGDEGYLYEEPYIAEALGLQEQYYLSDETIQQLAEQIYMIQTEAIRQGKAFVFVITPSKADFEREYIPARYYAMEAYYEEEERNYYRLIKAFDELGVFYVDGNTVLNEETIDYPVFYKTGIHWTRMAALTVLNETIDSLNTQYDTNIRTIECTGLEEVEEPWDQQDKDLYRILNIYRGQLDETYYWPEESPIMTGDDELPKIFIQGGSFTNKLGDIASDNQLFSELWREFYARSIYDYNRKIGYSTENLDTDEFKQAICQADIIMLESNVENINKLMPDLYDAIYRCLQEE